MVYARILCPYHGLVVKTVLIGVGGFIVVYAPSLLVVYTPAGYQLLHIPRAHGTGGVVAVVYKSTFVMR